MKRLIVDFLLNYWEALIVATVAGIVRGLEKCKMRQKYEGIIKRILNDLKR